MACRGAIRLGLSGRSAQHPTFSFTARLEEAPAVQRQTETYRHRGTLLPYSGRPSQSAVETSECAGKHERHDQEAGPECEHVRGFAQVEAADATDEQVGDGKVEQAPQHIDR